MRHFYDVVIVGSGLAGLTCAIYLKKSGIHVVVMTKETAINETNTLYAQGGIIASRDGDSGELLRNDMLRAGSGYNNLEAVDFFVNNGPPLVFDFLVDEVGIQFSRSEEGKIDYTEEAAHSKRRIVHYEDHTGDKIEDSLVNYAKRLGVEFLPD
ncbi:MAG: FAD-dependent oxidoreductase, partial [Bacteroidales bacterium]